MAKQELLRGKNWYVIHTYAGYEEAVAKSLLQRVENLGMQDKIFNVLVPYEKKVKIKNGKRKVVEEKIYPGYVLVEMVVTDDSWYVVRNTPNVTGFVGSSTTPVPVSSDEIDILTKRMGAQEPEFNVDFEIDDKVRIVDGAFKDYDGKVAEIDKQHGKIKVLVNMFGRDTPVELDTLQVKKM